MSDAYAVTWQGNVYCAGCIPDGPPKLEAQPLLPSAVVDDYPSCDVCGELHDYMQLEVAGESPRELVQLAIDDLDRLLERASFVPGADQPRRVRAVNATQSRLGALERRIKQDDYTDTEAQRDLAWLQTTGDTVRQWLG